MSQAYFGPPGRPSSPARLWVSLVLLPLLWLLPAAFGGRAFVPYDLAEAPPASLALTPAALQDARDGANHDVTEVPIWFLPELQLARATLAAGRLPTWNPWARGGAPLHAHGLCGLCYPPNWLALGAADPAHRLWLLAWISLSAAGLLAFGFLRALGLSPVAAWTGAATFALSAPLAANALFWMRLASLVWLPGVLWALLALDRAPALRAGPLLALAGAMAMTWLAGFPPYAVASTMLAAAFGAVLVAQRWRQRGARAAAWLLAAMLAGAGGGLLLAAPQLLPSLQFFAVSVRTADPDLATVAGSRFDWYGLLGYVAPDLFGHPSRTAELPYDRSPLCLWLATGRNPDGTAALPNFNYTEYSVFAGSLALPLAVHGACCGRGRLRLFALAAFLLLLSMATFVPGLHLLFLLPGIRSVWPMRWLAPATLLLAWLAALGVEQLRARAGRSRLPVVLALCLLLAVALLAAWLDPATWAGRLGVAEALARRYGVDAEAARHYVNDGAPPGADRFVVAGEVLRAALHARLPWLLAAVLLLALGPFAAARPALLWLLPLAAAAELGAHGASLTQGCRLAHPVRTPVHDFLAAARAAAAADGGFTVARASPAPGLPSQLPPGELLPAAIRDLHFDTHYDARSHEPLLRLFGERIAGKGYLSQSLPDDERLEHPLLDLLGVRFLLATTALRHAGARVGPRFAGPGGEFFVYERPHPLPRAFVVPRLTVLADDAAVLAAMVDPGFAPRETAFATAADLGGRTAPPSAGAAAARRVRFAVDAPTEVALDVDAGPEGWLVLTDTLLPGWTAQIDGAPAPIVRADHSMRACALPAAACRVRFLYAAPGLGRGLLLAALAAAGLLAAAILARRSRRRGSGADTAM